MIAELKQENLCEFLVMADLAEVDNLKKSIFWFLSKNRSIVLDILEQLQGKPHLMEEIIFNL